MFGMCVCDYVGSNGFWGCVLVIDASNLRECSLWKFLEAELIPASCDAMSDRRLGVVCISGSVHVHIGLIVGEIGCLQVEQTGENMRCMIVLYLRFWLQSRTCDAEVHDIREDFP